MSSRKSYRYYYDRARTHQSKGDFDDAIACFETAFQRIEAGETADPLGDRMRADGGAISPPEVRVREALEGSVDQLLELYRWKQDHARALKLLERLERLQPELGQAHAGDVATLLIAKGDADEGLARLRAMADSEPNNIWVWNLLAAECIGLARYDEAEQYLATATSLTDASPEDVGQSYMLLYNLHSSQWGPGVLKALDAWRTACTHDESLTKLIPDVVRMLTYNRYFPQAEELLKEEPNVARQFFFKGLINWTGMGLYHFTAKPWQMLCDPKEPIDGREQAPDELAEANLRLHRPGKAIELLLPIVKKGEINIWRVLLLGFAHAQLADVGRAKHFLDVALKLSDAAWPRQSRPGTGSQRILSGMARVAYGEMALGDNTQAQLNDYFIPRRVEEEEE